jgi:hypothetical protein
MAGRLRHVSNANKVFEQVVLVSTRCKPLVLHPELGRLFVLEQHQRDSAKDAGVGVGVALPDTAMALAERSIQLPCAARSRSPNGP